MIRFRQRLTNAEAEWDQGRWSGDPDLVRLCELLMRHERLPAWNWDPYSAIQDAIAREFPKHGLTIVEQTPAPTDLPPWNPDAVC